MGAQILPMGSGFPQPPDSLGDAGRIIWDTGRQLWLEGQITTRDLVAWEMYCDAFDEIAHCDSVVQRDGEYTASSQGTFSEHPALRRRRSAESKIARYQKLFGLVPEARKKRPAISQGVATRPK